MSQIARSEVVDKTTDRGGIQMIIDTTVKPLKPPLAGPGRQPGAAHRSPPPPAVGTGSPAAPPRERQKSPSPKPGAGLDTSWKPGIVTVRLPGVRSPGSPYHRKRLTCRECRVKVPLPAAGWYSLDRRVVPGSVPPDILSEAERRTWARSNRQWLGVYCSLACLRQSLGRLEKLDRMFREKGVGTRLAGLLAERAIDARRTQELGAE
jgi:hypothetical protein